MNPNRANFVVKDIAADAWKSPFGTEFSGNAEIIHSFDNFSTLGVNAVLVCRLIASARNGVCGLKVGAQRLRQGEPDL
jgi:hypothetical protein